MPIANELRRDEDMLLTFMLFMLLWGAFFTRHGIAVCLFELVITLAIPSINEKTSAVLHQFDASFFCLFGSMAVDFLILYFIDLIKSRKRRNNEKYKY